MLKYLLRDRCVKANLCQWMYWLPGPRDSRPRYRPHPRWLPWSDFGTSAVEKKYLNYTFWNNITKKIFSLIFHTFLINKIMFYTFSYLRKYLLFVANSNRKKEKHVFVKTVENAKSVIICWQRRRQKRRGL